MASVERDKVKNESYKPHPSSCFLTIGLLVSISFVGDVSAERKAGEYCIAKLISSL